MTTATVERINGDLVAVLDRTSNSVLGVRLSGDLVAEGQTVECEQLWGNGYEGDAYRVRGKVCPVEIYARGRTPDEIADNLGVDVDDLGLTK